MLEQRISVMLFYGVMLLVVLTCGAELGRMWTGLSADWASAFGSWFGGAGSFAAASVALYISRSEVRARREDEKRERDSKAFAVAARYFQIADELLASFDKISENIETGLSEAIYYEESLEDFVTSLCAGAHVFSFDIARELPYLDETAADVIALHTALLNYFKTVDLLRDRKSEFIDDSIESLGEGATYIKLLLRAIIEKTRSILERKS